MFKTEQVSFLFKVLSHTFSLTVNRVTQYIVAILLLLSLHLTLVLFLTWEVKNNKIHQYLAFMFWTDC